ncbi:hypothetical protein Hanom_Chr07g00663941 [Helianthus anomalus]
MNKILTDKQIVVGVQGYLSRQVYNLGFSSSRLVSFQVFNGLNIFQWVNYIFVLYVSTGLQWIAFNFNNYSHSQSPLFEKPVTLYVL